MKLKNIFLNKENRIHIFIKLPIFLFIMNYLMKNVFQNLTLYVTKYFMELKYGRYFPPKEIFEMIRDTKFLFIAFEIVFITLTLFFAIYVDKFTVKDLGLKFEKGKVIKFLKGFLVSAIILSLYMLVNVFLNNISMEYIGFSDMYFKTLFISIILLILVAFQEEFLMRAYVIKNFNKKWFIVPILASSLIFAYLHKDNPNINIMAYINIFLIGIIWGYYFIKTNDLYMPIGMHFAWNFIQGPIMGFNVSGINFLGLAKSQIVNEGILVGNAFGPESSILITILLVILIAFMKKMINTKDSVV